MFCCVLRFKIKKKELLFLARHKSVVFILYGCNDVVNVKLHAARVEPCSDAVE